MCGGEKMRRCGERKEDGRVSERVCGVQSVMLMWGRCVSAVVERQL